MSDDPETVALWREIAADRYKENERLRAEASRWQALASQGIQTECDLRKELLLKTEASELVYADGVDAAYGEAAVWFTRPPKDRTKANLLDAIHALKSRGLA
jgi:hypothetical protein